MIRARATNKRLLNMLLRSSYTVDEVENLVVSWLGVLVIFWQGVRNSLTNTRMHFINGINSFKCAHIFKCCIVLLCSADS